MKRTIRGIRDKIPGGYVIGRLPGRGNGPVTLIKFNPAADNSVGGSGSGGSGATSINIEIFAGSLMRSGEIIGQIIAPVAFTLPTGLAGSFGKAVTASTGTLVLTIRKATAAGGTGSAIGTITFTTSVTGVIVFSADVAFAIGDRLLIVAGSPADATLSDTTVLLVGNL